MDDGKDKQIKAFGHLCLRKLCSSESKSKALPIKPTTHAYRDSLQVEQESVQTSSADSSTRDQITMPDENQTNKEAEQDKEREAESDRIHLSNSVEEEQADRLPGELHVKTLLNQVQAYGNITILAQRHKTISKSVKHI